MLDFNFWSIFWAVLNVLILFAALRIFLFKPINKMLDDRRQAVQKDYDDAETARKEAEELKQQYADSISEAKEEAGNIIRKAHEDAEAERAAIINLSHSEAEQIISSANTSIENERKRVIQEAHFEIADLAIEAASKIVGENLDDEKNRRIVDEFLSREEDEQK
ncbi:MAG: F0F1 ATP synthase subunit B [Ruminococcus sp.]|nr:F0F1 ATP synthase subunit B [Ruminococcus sp.]